MIKIVSKDALGEYRDIVLKRNEKYTATICVCGGTGCHAQNALVLYEAFKKELKKEGLSQTVDLKPTGCHGFCEMGPIVVIRPKGIFYKKVNPEDASRIIRKTIINDILLEDLLYVNPEDGEVIPKEKDIPFYAKQERLIMSMNGIIDSHRIDDYIAQGGYEALAKVIFEMRPEQVIEEVERSGLRGRGGAGFETAFKWRACRRASSADGVKYVLCNADEGDPGAFMDRSLLEGNPHLVIEGMAIGAYAIGSKEGYIYVRHEYPFAVENVLMAIDQARFMNLLGSNIMGSDLSFDIKVSVGGGSFVCGEETALMASIEGRIGEPRVKHIYPAERGLYNKPTNMNNVETWGNIPLILRNGAMKFAGVGTSSSKGTKVFSLVGKVNNTGLVEVPMGIELRKIVYEIGGGIPGGKPFKAVQVGGPSGGCIPESLLDTPVDFDQLFSVGSMMGSGGMIVMDEDTCMVDIARYFLDFLCEESCGKCVPCREGLKQMQYLVTDITEGKGTVTQLDFLKELAEAIRDTSLCGLGQTAPNPVLSTLKHFYEEYRQHIEEKRCMAGVCKALVEYSIDPEKCTGCMVCKKACPVDAISGDKKEPHIIDGNKCEKCAVCYQKCKFGAIIRK